MHDGCFTGAKHAKNMKRDVYLFFDNTDKLRAPRDAKALMKKLGLFEGDEKRHAHAA